jgi:hypothetical protein
MSDKNSIQDVANIINIEGLGYAVQLHTSPESIENKTLADLWQKASDALNAIDRFLTDELGDNWQE